MGEEQPVRFGRYELIALLGRGGMGEVWKVRDRELGRIVALKHLSTASDTGWARFRREAQVVARLSHPNIAQVYELHDDPPALAMQFIDGTPLDDAPAASRLSALRDAARAIHYAHEQGVLHRDLKPANIMVDRSGRVFVLDFGLAREVRAEGTAMTVTGEVMGTPGYMAPEQARGDVHAFDARTDVYGLGATMYHILTGRAPHTGPNPWEIVRQVIVEEPVAPAGPMDLRTICLKALEKEPLRRYPSAAAFADDLDRYLRGELIEARPASIWYRLRTRIRRQPVVWGLSAALVAAVIGGAAFGVREVLKRFEAERDRADALRDAVEAARQREAQARAQGHVDRARALIADVQAVLYIEGASLEPFYERLQQARGVCEEALAELPDYAPAWYWIGRTYRVEGSNRRAIEALERATSLPGAAAYMWGDLGRAWQEYGRERYMAHSDDPDRSQRLLNEALERAADCFARSESGFEGIEAVTARAFAAFHAGRRDEARRLAEEAVREYGRVPGAEELEYLLGMFDDPSHLDRALEIRPGYAIALWALANRRSLEGDGAGAIETISESIRIFPRDAFGYMSRAMFRMQQRDLEGAEQDVEMAAQIDPLYAPALVNRASIRWSRGDREGALADCEAALAIEPDYPRVFRLRSFILEGTGELERAAADLRRGLELAGDRWAFRGECEERLTAIEARLDY